jgi:hypothetical protein
MGLPARDIRDPSLPVHASPPSAPHRDAGIDEMMDWIGRMCPLSGAEALRELRAVFPDAPLTRRVEALNALIRRKGGTTTYIPR